MFPVHNQGKTYPVQFRAGKLLREGDTKLVKPDPRQGMVMMDVGADHLTRFYWKDVKNNVIEDDLIVFPQEAIFEKVAESSQRVYVLKFNSSSQRLFFWMQDPKDEKDAENVARINQIINDPLSVNPAVAGDGLSQQIMRMFDQNYREEGASRSQAAPAGQLSNPQLSELRNIISNIEVPASQQAPLDLSRVLTPQAIGPLLNNPHICQALFPHLPESTSRTREEIEEVVRSSQFQQALRSLGAALESGALGPLVQQLGLDPSAANGVEAFLRAIERQAQQEGDDQMDVDESL